MWTRGGQVAALVLLPSRGREGEAGLKRSSLLLALLS